MQRASKWGLAILAAVVLAVPVIAAPSKPRQRTVASPRQTAAEPAPSDRVIARLKRLLVIVGLSDDMIGPRP